MTTETQPQFKPGDRFFSHYSMGWGTVLHPTETYRDQKHGVTGSKLPDTTWYSVDMDNGDHDTYDDAHGNWDMARMIPPHIAKRFGYGDDPLAPLDAAWMEALVTELQLHFAHELDDKQLRTAIRMGFRRHNTKKKDN